MKAFLFVLLTVFIASSSCENVLINAGFEDGGAYWWHDAVNPAYTVVSEDCHGGVNCARIDGDLTHGKGCWHQVTSNSHPSFSHSTNEKMIISAWSKSSNIVPDSTLPEWQVQIGYSVFADVKYADGSWHYGIFAKFDPAQTEGVWTKARAIFTPTKDIAEVNLHGFLRFNTGTAWFDDFVVSTYVPVATAATSYAIGMIPSTIPVGHKFSFEIIVRDQEIDMMETEAPVDVTFSGSSFGNCDVSLTESSFSRRTVECSFPLPGVHTVEARVNGELLSTYWITAELAETDFLKDYNGNFDVAQRWNWSPSESSGDFSYVTTTECRTNQCLRISSSTTVHAYQWSIPIVHDQPEVIKIGGYYRVQSGSVFASGAVFTASTHDTMNNANYGYEVWGAESFAPDTWHHVEVTVPKGAYPIKEIIINLYCQASASSATVYFDDFYATSPAKSPLDPAASFVSGLLASYESSATPMATITAVAIGGEQKTTGGDVLEATLVREDNTVTHLVVTDNNDGTYSVPVAFPSAGVFQFMVKFFGVAFTNLPAAVTVSIPHGSELVHDAGFDAAATFWTSLGSGFTQGDSVISVVENGGALQTFEMNEEVAFFEISGASKSSGLTGGASVKYAVVLKSLCADGTEESVALPFAPNSNTFETVSATIAVGKVVSSVELSALFFVSGAAEFDSFSLKAVSSGTGQCAGVICGSRGVLNIDDCSCVCDAPWTGSPCTTCPLTCQNGAVRNEETCSCPCTGNWAGMECEECQLVESECAGTINPDTCECIVCPSTCVHGEQDPLSCVCSCERYWTGDLCDTCVHGCINDGALNEDTCLCSCNDPWTGDDCEVCQRTCANGGSLDGPTCSCACDGNWTGEVCDECVYSCSSHGLLHLDTCTCGCNVPWVGEDCSVCHLSCANDGLLNSDDCTCSCPGHWGSMDCSECDLTCNGHGSLDEFACACTCDHPWTGDDCDSCPLICLNGGVKHESDCTCACNGGWEGERCDTCDLSCPLNSSLNPVSCSCECDNKWATSGTQEGVICDECIFECQNGGALQNDCTCLCPAGFSGDACNILDSGACTQICVNGGLNTDTCLCECAEGSLWSGLACSKCPDAATGSSLCIHGSFDELTCSCACEQMWMGRYCNECTLQCLNGKLDFDTCSCTCDEGFSGTTCNVINESELAAPVYVSSAYLLSGIPSFGQTVENLQTMELSGTVEDSTTDYNNHYMEFTSPVTGVLTFYVPSSVDRSMLKDFKLITNLHGDPTQEWKFSLKNFVHPEVTLTNTIPVTYSSTEWYEWVSTFSPGAAGEQFIGPSNEVQVLFSSSASGVLLLDYVAMNFVMGQTSSSCLVDSDCEDPGVCHYPTHCVNHLCQVKSHPAGTPCFDGLNVAGACDVAAQCVPHASVFASLTSMNTVEGKTTDQPLSALSVLEAQGTGQVWDDYIQFEMVPRHEVHLEFSVPASVSYVSGVQISVNLISEAYHRAGSMDYAGQEMFFELFDHIANEYTHMADLIDLEYLDTWVWSGLLKTKSIPTTIDEHRYIVDGTISGRIRCERNWPSEFVYVDYLVVDLVQCGDGIVNPYNEQCDGGANCLADCTCAPGFVPTAPHTASCQAEAATCNNGILDAHEECDGGAGCINCHCGDGLIPTRPVSFACRNRTPLSFWDDAYRHALVANVDPSAQETTELRASTAATLANEHVTFVEMDGTLSDYAPLDLDFKMGLKAGSLLADHINSKGLKTVMYYPTLEVITAGGQNESVPSMFKEHPEWAQASMVDGSQNVFYGAGVVFWVDPGAESCWLSPNSPWREIFQRRVEIMADSNIDGAWLDVPIYFDGIAPWHGGEIWGVEAFKRDTNLTLPTGTPENPLYADFEDEVFRKWVVWRHENIHNFLVETAERAMAVNDDFRTVIEIVTMDYLDGVRLGLDGGMLRKTDGIMVVWEVDVVSLNHSMAFADHEDWSAFISMNKYAKGASGNKPSWVFSYGEYPLDARATMAVVMATGNNPYEVKTPTKEEGVDTVFRTRVFGWAKTHKEHLFSATSEHKVLLFHSSSSRDFDSTGIMDPNTGAILPNQFGTGLLCSETHPDDNYSWWVKGDSTMGCARQMYHGDYRGMSMLLHENQIPFDLMTSPFLTLDDLTPADVIVAPSLTAISDNDAALFTEYVQGGGTLVLTGPFVGNKDFYGTVRGSLESTENSSNPTLVIGHLLVNGNAFSELFSGVYYTPGDTLVEFEYGSGRVIWFTDRVGKDYIVQSMYPNDLWLQDDTGVPRTLYYNDLIDRVKSYSTPIVSVSGDKYTLVEARSIGTDLYVNLVNLKGGELWWSVIDVQSTMRVPIKPGTTIQSVDVTSSDMDDDEWHPVQFIVNADGEVEASVTVQIHSVVRFRFDTNFQLCDKKCNNGGLLNTWSCECECAEGFSGESCEECERLCLHNGALNRDTCTCSDCSAPWTGDRCEVCTKACDNGGIADPFTCECVCKDGWSGDSCSQCVRDCGHGGVLDAESCLCTGCNPGWSGVSCDVCIRDCIHGELVSDTCVCECIGGFIGDECDTCSFSTCNNGGTFHADTCSCSCVVGFGGPQCNEQCPHGCTNGGVLQNDCTCACEYPWAGQECETCTPFNCLTGGQFDEATCSCHSCSIGFSGIACEICHLECANGGKLMDDYCQCDCYTAGNWEGPSCETCPITECSSNGVITGVFNAATCECTCNSGWTGRDCSVAYIPIDTDVSTLVAPSGNAYVGHDFSVDAVLYTNGAKFTADHTADDVEVTVTDPNGDLVDVTLLRGGDGSLLTSRFHCALSGSYSVSAKSKTTGNLVSNAPVMVNSVEAVAFDMRAAVFVATPMPDVGMRRFTESGDSTMDVVREMLHAMAIPYDVIPVLPLREAGEHLTLTHPDGSPKYYFHIFLTSDLEYETADGGYSNALSFPAPLMDEETREVTYTEGKDYLRIQLLEYERKFNIRRIVLSANPWSHESPCDPVVAPGRVEVGTEEKLSVFLTPYGKQFATGLTNDAEMTVHGYHFTTAIKPAYEPHSSIVAYDTLGGEQHASVVTTTQVDGREQMHVFFNMGVHETASVALFPAMVQWATRNLYHGYRRMLVGLQIDDQLLKTEEWELWSDANTGPAYRNTCYDLQWHKEWQLRTSATLPEGSDIRLELAVNGFGWVYDDEQPEGDKAGVCLQGHMDDFFIVSHTYTHLSLDAPRNYTYCLWDLDTNKEFLLDKLCPLNETMCSMNGLVPPMITGLFNGPALHAMETVGIDGVVGDNTLDHFLGENMFHQLITNTTGHGWDGVKITPRFAAHVDYDCSLPECAFQKNVKYIEADWLGVDTWENKTLSDVLDAEAVFTATYIAGYQHDPYMFHQANMRVFEWDEAGDGVMVEDSLVTMWFKALDRALKPFNNLPLISEKHDVFVDRFEQRRVRDISQSSAKMFVDASGNVEAVQLEAPSGDAKVVVSSFQAKPGSPRLYSDMYGPDVNVWADMKREDLHTLWLDETRAWGAISPEPLDLPTPLASSELTTLSVVGPKRAPRQSSKISPRPYRRNAPHHPGHYHAEFSAKTTMLAVVLGAVGGVSGVGLAVLAIVGVAAPIAAYRRRGAYRSGRTSPLPRVSPEASPNSSPTLRPITRQDSVVGDMVELPSRLTSRTAARKRTTTADRETAERMGMV